MQQDYMTVAEAARYLQLSGERIRVLERMGRIRALRTRYGRLFERQEIERVAAERQARRTATA